MQIIRKRLSETEGQPPNTRYNPECDCVEITVNGGVTWTQDDGSDPRVNPAFMLPPNDKPDVRCAAAGGMVAMVRSSVDAAIDTSTVIGLANGIFAIIVAFLPITILAAVVLAIAEFLVGLGAAALIGAFTEPVYQQILCIIYCHLDSSGRLTEEGLAGVQADVTAQIGDIVVDGVLAAIISATGYVGFNNAGSALANEDADCSECECGWVAEWDQALFESEWTFDFGSHNANFYIDAHIMFGLTCVVSGGCYQYTNTGGSQTGSQAANWFTYDYATLLDLDPLCAPDGTSFLNNEFTLPGIAINPVDNTAAGAITITRVKLWGTGDPPLVGVLGGVAGCEDLCL